MTYLILTESDRNPNPGPRSGPAYLDVVGVADIVVHLIISIPLGGQTCIMLLERLIARSHMDDLDALELMLDVSKLSYAVGKDGDEATDDPAHGLCLLGEKSDLALEGVHSLLKVIIHVTTDATLL